MYLEMNEIKKSFGDGGSRTEVLRGISCGVEKGAVCVLLGPSGSGKSTLLNIIGGIETADSDHLAAIADGIYLFHTSYPCLILQSIIIFPFFVGYFLELNFFFTT